MEIEHQFKKVTVKGKNYTISQLHIDKMLGHTIKYLSHINHLINSLNFW